MRPKASFPLEVQIVADRMNRRRLSTAAGLQNEQASIAQPKT
jgi:hypothetical protein